MSIFDLDNWAEIWVVLRANKLRTGLTAFGVAWGIFMLVVMLAFGSSMQTGMRRNMGGMATNMLFVWGQTTTQPFNGMKPGRVIQFKTDDIERLRRLPDVAFIAPQAQLPSVTGFNVTYGTKAGSYNVYGELADFQHVIAFQYLAGRFIDDEDNAQHRKVAVIGAAVMNEMYPRGANPIGTFLKINGVYFEVVGVVKTLRQGENGDRDAHSVYVPFATLRTSFHLGDQVQYFAITATPTADGPALEQRIRSALYDAHKIAPTDKLAIGSFNMFEMFGKIESLFFWLWAISWIVGGLTLAAGVIGVSNIMLIAVKERTKEFGVRKALGATPGSVIGMVLMETIAITTLAGLAGIAYGAAVLYAADQALAKALDSPFGPPAIGLSTVAAAFGVLVATATLAGLIPALHAASIKPIEALRTD